AFAESIGVAVVVSDADGVAIEANTVARELFAGVLRSSVGSFLESRITDHPWRLLREDGGELAPEDSPAAYARATGEPVRDRVVGFVIGHEAPRWLMQSAVPFERDDEPGRYDVVSTYVDITARRELEA